MVRVKTAGGGKTEQFYLMGWNWNRKRQCQKKFFSFVLCS
jgi:hypothetical protein